LSIDKLKKNYISENFRRLKDNLGLTTAQICQKTGITLGAVRHYEIERSVPPTDKVNKLADFFGVSADFLLLWDQIKYPRSVRLLSLAEKINAMEVDRWHNVKTTTATFLDDVNANKEPEIVFDNLEIELTNSIHQNIWLLRNRVEYNQAKLGRYLSQTASQVSNYETGKSTPPADKLILMSVLFQTSVHAIATGRKLYFKFHNKDFKNTMLNADYYLSLKKKDFICEMMEKIIEKSKARTREEHGEDGTENMAQQDDKGQEFSAEEKSPQPGTNPRPLNSAERPSEGS